MGDVDPLPGGERHRVNFARVLAQFFKVVAAAHLAEVAPNDPSTDTSSNQVNLPAPGQHLPGPVNANGGDGGAGAPADPALNNAPGGGG